MTGILPKDNDIPPFLNPLDRWLLQDDDEKSKPGPNNNAKYHAAQEANQSLDILRSLYLSSPSSLSQAADTVLKGRGALLPELLAPPAPLSVPYSDPREQDIHAQIDAISVGEFQFGDTADIFPVAAESDPSELYPEGITAKETLATCISNHSQINSDYYQEKGITQAIIKLSHERFNMDPIINLRVLGKLVLATDTLIYDLKTKECKDLDLSEEIWVQISLAIRTTVTDCVRLDPQSTKIQHTHDTTTPSATKKFTNLLEKTVTNINPATATGNVCRFLDTGTPSWQEIDEAIQNGTRIKGLEPEKWIEVKAKLAPWILAAETINSSTSFLADNTKKAFKALSTAMSFSKEISTDKQEHESQT